MRVLPKLSKVLIPALLICGCAGTTPDPSQTTAPENSTSQAITTFARDVPPGDYIKLQVAEKIRSVDPCALIDTSQLAAYGVIGTVGPQHALSECVVELDRPGSRLTASVKVELNTNGPTTDDKVIDLAGERVALDTVHLSSFGCTYQVPMRLGAPPATNQTSAAPDIVELPPETYMSVAVSEFADSQEGNCTVAREVITTILARFAENRVPQRDQAQIRIPLTDRAPCALLEHIPAGVRVERFDASTEPYECKFWVDGEIVTMEFAAERAEVAMRPVGDMRLDTIDGHSVLVSESEFAGDRMCDYRFSVGAPVVDAGDIQSLGKLNGRCAATTQLISPALAVFDAN
jgi:hypothetical protein